MTYHLTGETMFLKKMKPRKFLKYLIENPNQSGHVVRVSAKTLLDNWERLMTNDLICTDTSLLPPKIRTQKKRTERIIKCVNHNIYLTLTEKQFQKAKLVRWCWNKSDQCAHTESGRRFEDYIGIPYGSGRSIYDFRPPQAGPE